MTGWGDSSRADTLSTADETLHSRYDTHQTYSESLQMEVTIDQHLQHQRSLRQEQKSQTRKSAPSDASNKIPPRRNRMFVRWVIFVLAGLVVICAGLAVGFHFHNQSVLEEEQSSSAAAISTSDEEGDTTAPSGPLVPQSPTALPSQTAATGSPTQITPAASPTFAGSESPSLTTIVIEQPLSTNAPSVAPTQADSTVNVPLNPTLVPSLRSSLRPETAPSIAPSSVPTAGATTVATNRHATINPTVSPTIATGAHTGTPSLRSSDLLTPLPTVDTSVAPTSKPSLRASSTSTIIPTASPTTSSPTAAPTQEFSALPTVPPTETPTRESSEMPTTSTPTEAPTRNTPAPTNRPTIATPPPTSNDFSTVVIEPDSRLDREEYVFSPNGKYRVGLSEIGDFELIDTTTHTHKLIWNANITGGYRVFMQGDGNCIIRDENGNGLWSTKTSKNYDSRLVLDNRGMLGILYNETYLWIQGVPRGTFDDESIGVPSPNDLQFPVRGAFYYPWYPETWKTGGKLAVFQPDDPLGYYNSADPAVVDAHLDHFEYGHIELGILSWWGRSKNNDRARISLIQNMTQARGSNIKWTMYYEEMDVTRTLRQVQRDLAYLKFWYAWHDTWAKVDGKPVIFVYHNSGCDNTVRWMQAAKGEWYVVLKIFDGFEECEVQPSSWHNYGPAREVLYYEGHSFSISPGFWHAAETEPRLPRVNQTRWCEMVSQMVDSQAPWQLITTFNEAGEGTMIEPSASWASDSGYGYYLDCLHQIH